ncbi:hypothetical protein H310_05905 [Aphanomyces invadans]|uniref:Uncharacterized protein n=1 Tax=Aphanomyces invadans TaxID=157072 RepID=A0A024U801_9STRA|nr:hypothetical protein H310_05905 [Aphanomyces invadans]ETW02379.1 hypothetical protein H310_05905 [Aphanomyces invadans]|eukprot:XP_008868984.1 hypothetical protein H310_05905 [Aphanomyces invadans]
MGNTCMSAKYAKQRLPKASHTDDDDGSFTRDKPMISTTFSDPLESNHAPPPARTSLLKEYPPHPHTMNESSVADAIRCLRDSADLKTLSTLAAVTHQPGPTRKFSLLTSDLPDNLPRPSARLFKLSPDTVAPSSCPFPLSAVVVQSPDRTPPCTTHVTSHANLRDIEASSHDTIRQTKENLDLLRQIQAMHDEAARLSRTSSSVSDQSSKMSASSDARSNSSTILHQVPITQPVRRSSATSSSGASARASVINAAPSEPRSPSFGISTAPIVVSPAPSVALDDRSSSLFVVGGADHVNRYSVGDRSSGGIPMLSERGEEAIEGHKPSICFSSPRSSCPVIDTDMTRDDSFVCSPSSRSIASPTSNPSHSFSMSPRANSFNFAVRPTALSLESLRFTQTSVDFGRDTAAFGMRDTSASFGGAFRDTRSSMAFDVGLYL